MSYQPTQRPAPPRPPASPTRPKRQAGAWGTILRVLSTLVCIYAVYSALGISALFDYNPGMSEDDADLARDRQTEEIGFELLVPVGSILLGILLLVSFFLHRLSKRHLGNESPRTRTTLIITLIAFVLSLFKFSSMLPLVLGTFGHAATVAMAEADEREPAAEDFAIEGVEVAKYLDLPDIRVSGSLRNASDLPWQWAKLLVVYTDADGVECGATEHTEHYVSGGDTRAFTTERVGELDFAVPSCNPVAADVSLSLIDLDSRSEIDETDYWSQTPVFASLAPIEEEHVAEYVLISVGGSLDMEADSSFAFTTDGVRPPASFELVDHDGIRLDTCLVIDELTPEGHFFTTGHHSPVITGQFPSVAVVPSC